MALAITGVSPAFVLAEASADVTISGRGFQQGARVTFGETPVEVLSITSTLITVRVPPKGPGTAAVAVENPDGTRVLHGTLFGFTAIELRGVSPKSGPPTMFTQLLIGFFPPGARVTIGGLNAPITFTSVTGAIYVRVPDNGARPGPVEVAIVRPDGKIESVPDAFTYELVTITPSALDIAAGAPMSVSWFNPVNWYNDFFADALNLYKVGDPNAPPVWSGEAWTDTGSYNLRAPLEPGTYRFKFLVSNQQVEAGFSPVITVTSGALATAGFPR